MSITGLNWQSWTMRFVAGLNQKADARSLESPELARCIDAAFDKVGALHTRYPFAAIGNNISGGGTITNARRLTTRDGEILLFTDTALYSWDSDLSVWVNRGTHLAVATDEQIRFATTGDQPFADRAELGTAVVYTWVESSTVYWAATSKTTGAVTVPPQSLGLASRPRVVALSTKILITFVDTANGDLNAFAINPASMSTYATSGLGSGTVVFSAVGGFNGYYDIVRAGTTDGAVWAARRLPTTSYEVGLLSASLVVVKATKARVCAGPIAVSWEPNSAKLQIARDYGNDAGTYRIRGDLLDASLVDVYTNQEIGTYPVNVRTIADHVTCAHRSVQNSSQYRCYVYWSTDEDTPSTSATTTVLKSNWVDTGNTLGTQANFLAWCSVGSRAFSYNGSVYVWAVFNDSAINYGFLQGTYLLYRDDGLLVAASRVGNAWWSGSYGHLPGVAATTDETAFAWCGVFVRDVSNLGNQAGHARAPRDITFTFDSDEARRCTQIGKTLYISGSPIIQYDGVQLTECGFLIGPHHFEYPGDAGGGSMLTGAFSYKPTLRWMNATGETERSSSFELARLVTTAGDNRVVTLDNVRAIWTTRKDKVAYEFWRTPVNPTADGPFYLTTDSDPAGTAPNAYLLNTKTALTVSNFTDSEADTTTTTHETNPENGDVLENLPPPSARIIESNGTRVFLAGVAGDPHRVWYSKQRNDGEVPAFHDGLTVDIPAAGGAITALAFLNETLVVFRERAIYALDGSGLDNTGGGQNYNARTISTDLGATSHEAVCATDDGIWLHSNKGKWLLNRGWQLAYIGAGVTDYDDEDVISVHAIETKHEVRWLTSSRMLVFNTLAKQWSEWTINDAIHACMWNGAHHYTTETTVKAEQTTYTGVDYGMDIELASLKLEDLQGYGAIDFFDLLGEYRSECSVQIQLARDYQTSYFQDKTHTPSGLTAGQPLEVRHRPSIRQVKALKVRITIEPTAAGESVRLTGIAFKLGIQPGLNRNVLQTSKQ